MEWKVEPPGERAHRVGIAGGVGTQRVVDMTDGSSNAERTCAARQGGCQRDRIGAARARDQYRRGAREEVPGLDDGAFDDTTVGHLDDSTDRARTEPRSRAIQATCRGRAPAMPLRRRSVRRARSAVMVQFSRVFEG